MSVVPKNVPIIILVMSLRPQTKVFYGNYFLKRNVDLNPTKNSPLSIFWTKDYFQSYFL